MRLVELDPQFLRYEVRQLSWVEVHGNQRVDVSGPRGVFVRVDTVQQAQGIRFLCPKCFLANKGPVGTHSVVCWSRSAGVPNDAKPGPGRWRLVGTGYGDLSLVEEPGQSSSVRLLSGCMWHGFVTGGAVR